MYGIWSENKTKEFVKLVYQIFICDIFKGSAM